MATPSRMPRYDVQNDGVGPYAVFYCDECNREFRSQPDVKSTIAKDITKDAAAGLLRRIPLLGAVADNVAGEDPRYSYKMTPQQLQAAWQQVQGHFRECPTCQKVVCLSDFDERSGTCNEDSPRREQLAQGQAEQAAGMIRGIAGAFGLGEIVRGATEAAKNAAVAAARCPKDGTLAAPGTKFCPQCGSPMVQPAADPCPKCGAETAGAKFCPQCGAKVERAPAAAKCPNCGAETKGAKFCPECGTRQEQPAPPPAKCPNCGAETKGAKFCAECGTKLA